jgi:3-deoxy-manno-octulosonate cytidylyltransferase (CMP-KDO synthetase)
LRRAIIIPARLASTRLPEKVLADLGGVPLVVQVARQARRCAAADVVAIATDSAAVLQAAQAHGFLALQTGAWHRSGTERVAEAAAALQADLIVNLQGDEPFIDPRDLDDVFALLQSAPPQSADIVSLHRPLSCQADIDDPSVVKVVCRDDGTALYFSRSPIPYRRDASSQVPSVFGHIGVYGCRRAALDRWQQAPPHPLELAEGLEQLRALAMGMRIAMLPARSRGRGIDTPQDLAWARHEVKANHVSPQS